MPIWMRCSRRRGHVTFQELDYESKRNKIFWSHLIQQEYLISSWKSDKSKLQQNHITLLRDIGEAASITSVCHCLISQWALGHGGLRIPTFVFGSSKCSFVREDWEQDLFLGASRIQLRPPACLVVEQTDRAGMNLGDVSSRGWQNGEKDAPFHSFLSWVRCLCCQDCSDVIIASKKELVEVTKDECDICDWEHRMWPRLCRLPLNNNAVRRDFYCEPLLILHNKKKFHAEERNQKLSLNLEVASSSEAADILPHWITHTHSYPQKKIWQQ